MLFIGLLLLSALMVSAVAGFFSISGLVAIFPAAATSIAIMGASLELAKLTAASWLYRNWKTAPILMKSYFTVAVVVLSLITSMGIMGYLSRAHVQNDSVGATQALMIEQLVYQKTAEETKIKNAQTQLNNMDRITSTGNAADSNFIMSRQKNARTNINEEIATSYKTIADIQTKLLPLQQQAVKLESEVGPLKYVAQLLYNTDGAAGVDKAVRLIIISLIFVFDPLAILLVVAANISILQMTRTKRVYTLKHPRKKKKPEPKVKPKKSVFLSIGTTDEVQTIEPNIEANTDSDGLLASIEKTFGKIPKFNMFGKKQDT